MTVRRISISFSGAEWSSPGGDVIGRGGKPVHLSHAATSASLTVDVGAFSAESLGVQPPRQGRRKYNVQR
jgi:hypothetical protein